MKKSLMISLAVLLAFSGMSSMLLVDHAQAAFNPVWQVHRSYSFTESEYGIRDMVVVGHTLVGHGINGYFHRSTDGGETWSQYKSDTPVFWNEAVVTDAQTIIVGGNLGSISRSVDGGNNWFTSTLTNAGNIKGLIQLEDGSIIAGADRGFYRSIDDGATWTQTHNHDSTQSFETIFDAGGGSVLVGFRNGIYKSDDYGLHWEHVHSEGFSHIHSFTQLQDGTLLAASLNYIYTLEGNVWRRLPASDTPNGIRTMHALENGKILVADNSRHIHQSLDHGKTWSAVPVTDLKVIDEFQELASGTLLAASGTNPGEIYRSSDQGQTWEIGLIVRDEGVRALLELENGSLIAGFSNGSVYKSTDDGASWEVKQKKLYHINELIKLDNGTILAGADRGRIYQSTDNGHTWNDMFINGDIRENDVRNINSIIQLENGTLLIAAHQSGSTTGHVLTSTDHGRTWLAVAQKPQRPLLSMLDLGHGKVLGAGNQGKVYISENNGNTWLEIADNSDAGVYYSLIEVDGRVLAGNSKAQVYYTDNPTHFGNSYYYIDQGVRTERINTIVSLGNGVLLAGLGNNGSNPGYIYRSTDNGEIWEQVEATDRMVNNLIYLGEDIVWAASGFDRNGQIYRSTDAGLSWQKMLDDDVQVNNLLHAGNGVIFTGSAHGKIMSTIDDFAIGVPPVQLDRIELSLQDIIINTGFSHHIRVTAMYSDGATEDVTDQATYSIANNTIAIVDATGTITGVHAGSTILTVDFEGQSALASVTVVEPPMDVERIEFRHSTYSLPISSTQQTVVEAVYDGDRTVLTSLASYSMADEDIATVNASGVVTGVSIGTTQLTAEYLGEVATTTIAVTDGLKGIAFDKSTYSVHVHSTAATVVESVYWSGNKYNISADATYRMADESIATVDATGLVTGKAAGSTTLTAHYEGKTTETIISVRTRSSGGSGGHGGGGGGGGSYTPPVADNSFIVTPQGNIEQRDEGIFGFLANTVTQETKITVDVIKATDNLFIEEGSRWLSKVIKLTKDTDEALKKEFSITLPFNTSLVDQEMVEVSLYWLDTENEAWVVLNQIEVDWAQGTVKGASDRLGIFAVISTKGTQEQVEQEDSQPSSVTFTDLSGHWAEDNLYALVERGAIQGYPDGSFRPNQTMTRAEFVAMVVSALELEGSSSGHIFSDTANHWARESIATAAANGLVSGYDEHIFGVSDPLTREQLAVILVRAAQLTSAQINQTFSDQVSISAWAAEAIATAVAQGIISGYPDGSFKPQQVATRAEAATVMLRVLQKK